MNSNRPFVLGVTGAIGAGKSTVCRALSARGWSVLDVDDVAAAVLTQNLSAVARRIPEILSRAGSLDKAALFAAMLRDPGLRRELENQLRPFVREQIRDWVEHLQGPGALDAALLFESGLDEFCQATLCVQCPQQERRQRVAQRPTASARHFDALEAAQWSESEKCARAGIVISTAGSATPLDNQLLSALTKLGFSY